MYETKEQREERRQAMHEKMLDLMLKYQWLTASVARYVLEHDIDYEIYFS